MTTNKPEVVTWLCEHKGRNACVDRRYAEELMDDGEQVAALIRLTDYQRLQVDHEASRTADKARIAELEAALSELRDWYQDHTSLPAFRADAALSQPKEDA